MTTTQHGSLVAQGSRDCPCPGIFKAVAYCDDCPYRTVAGALEPWLQRATDAARKGGEDSGWLFLFRAKILDLAAENSRLKAALNRERKYREAQEGLPEGTLPRV